MVKCINCFHLQQASPDDLAYKRCGVTGNTIAAILSPRNCGNYIEVNGVVNMVKCESINKDGVGEIRQFDSGATRDTNIGKLDYEGFFSPIVLKRYAKYLHKHRVQNDGKLRDSDNWQGMFGEKHYDICMKSAWRHFMDWWLEHRGYNISENGIEDAMMGLLFNVMAYSYKILKDKENNNG